MKRHVKLFGAAAVLATLTGCVGYGGAYGPGFGPGFATVGLMDGGFENGPGMFGPSFGDFEDFGGYGGLGGYGGFGDDDD